MIPLINKPNVDGSDSEYLYGNIRDKTGLIQGTPVNVEVYADMHQFFEKMMAESNVVANNLPDNEYNDWQLWEALQYACQNQRRYKRYYVNLSQTSTNAPTQDAQFENDLTTSPGFARTATGRYTLTFGGAEFPSAAKTVIWSAHGVGGGSVYAYWSSTTVIRIETRTAGGLDSDGILLQTPIMIRVYPS